MIDLFKNKCIIVSKVDKKKKTITAQHIYTEKEKRIIIYVYEKTKH